VVDSFLPDQDYHHTQGTYSAGHAGLEVEVEDDHRLEFEMDDQTQSQIQTETESYPNKTPEQDIQLIQAIHNLHANAHAQAQISSTREAPIPSYRPPHAISPFRILRPTKQPSSLTLPSSSPESAFDTPLSEKQRARRVLIAEREVKAKIAMDQDPDEMPGTPTPIRGGGLLVRSGSGGKFSDLDEGEEEEEEGERERGRRLWSAELEEMVCNGNGNGNGDYGSDTSLDLGKARLDRESSAGTVVTAVRRDRSRELASSPPAGMTPMKEITHSSSPATICSDDTPSSNSTSGSGSESELKLKEEEDSSGKLSPSITTT
jgi:hypothetical protein